MTLQTARLSIAQQTNSLISPSSVAGNDSSSADMALHDGVPHQSFELLVQVGMNGVMIYTQTHTHHDETAACKFYKHGCDEQLLSQHLSAVRKSEACQEASHRQRNVNHPGLESVESGSSRRRRSMFKWQVSQVRWGPGMSKLSGNTSLCGLQVPQKIRPHARQ
eukprot:TRINITY_DN11267_c0_g1_i5.p2 TRINITY_DN11267_c0_g1~~TRINITY_DN11267_c0_g1_i5.p2  ORF type:complete len:164 (-),score=18.05 TRINITY_DN11267_c0_g1_i5:218-709(-)